MVARPPARPPRPKGGVVASEHSGPGPHGGVLQARAQGLPAGVGADSKAHRRGLLQDGAAPRAPPLQPALKLESYVKDVSLCLLPAARPLESRPEEQ